MTGSPTLTFELVLPMGVCGTIQLLTRSPVGGLLVVKCTELIEILKREGECVRLCCSRYNCEGVAAKAVIAPRRSGLLNDSDRVVTDGVDYCNLCQMLRMGCGYRARYRQSVIS